MWLYKDISYLFAEINFYVSFSYVSTYKNKTQDVSSARQFRIPIF